MGPGDGEILELGVRLEDLGAVDRQRQGPAVARGVEGAVLDMAGDGNVDDEAHLVVVPLGPAGAGGLVALGRRVPCAEVEPLLAPVPAGDHGVLVAVPAVAAHVGEAQRDGAAQLLPGVARGSDDAVRALDVDAAHIEREPRLRVGNRGLTALVGGHQSVFDTSGNCGKCRGFLRRAGPDR